MKHTPVPAAVSTPATPATEREQLIDALLENVTGGYPLSCSGPRPVVLEGGDDPR